MKKSEMKLRFYWYVSDAYADGVIRPACRCIDPQEDSDEFVANYLMDGGGGGYLDSISWLNEGVGKINLIKSKRVDFINLSRDAWGADLSINGVDIYSLYDEGRRKKIALDALEKAMLKWIGFLQMKPELGTSLEVDLSSFVAD